MATKAKEKDQEAPETVEAPKFVSVKPHGWTDARSAIAEAKEKKANDDKLKELYQAGLEQVNLYLNPNGVPLGSAHNAVPEVKNARAFRTECREALKKLK